MGDSSNTVKSDRGFETTDASAARDDQERTEVADPFDAFGRYCLEAFVIA
jgi:hypothetical protein